jgi:heat shock protein HslJ
VKQEDLDDRAPIEADDEVLASVHARSRSFRKRRNTQRLTSVMTALVVLALAGGIAWTRVDSTNGRGSRPGPVASSTTTLPARTEKDIQGKWRPVSITGYFVGPLNTAYLSFDGRGSWTGSDGCNELSGMYQLDETGVRFDREVLSTTRGCGAGAETPDFGPIERAARSNIAGDQLTFLTADGGEIARVVRAVVTARIELPSTTMTAGSKMAGRIVIENNTGHVFEASGCGSLFTVMLGNDAIHADPAWRLCAQPLPIPVGESTYPVMVWAAYQACSVTPHATMPLGKPGGGPASLPPANYQPQFFQSSPVVTPAPPIDITVEPQSTP